MWTCVGFHQSTRNEDEGDETQGDDGKRKGVEYNNEEEEQGDREESGLDGYNDGYEKGESVGNE